MKFYSINNDYANYLRLFCPNIPKTDYSRNGKCKCFLELL